MDNPAPVQMTKEARGTIKLTRSRNPHQREKPQPSYALPKTQKHFSFVVFNVLKG